MHTSAYRYRKLSCIPNPCILVLTRHVTMTGCSYSWGRNTHHTQLEQLCPSILILPTFNSAIHKQSHQLLPLTFFMDTFFFECTKSMFLDSPIKCINKKSHALFQVMTFGVLAGKRLNFLLVELRTDKHLSNPRYRPLESGGI